MVNGCEILAKEHQLWFWTVTCRGKECSYEEAIENYGTWTNRLLTACRVRCKRANGYWSFAQVTEHQKKTRSHPHSHFITTYNLDRLGVVEEGGIPGGANLLWFRQANVAAGLGEQCRVSRVRSASAASRYVAKYMFKATVSETWPAGWKRIRYSQNWPELPVTKPDLAIVLRTKSDWREAEKTKVRWQCDEAMIFELAAHHIANLKM